MRHRHRKVYMDKQTSRFCARPASYLYKGLPARLEPTIDGKPIATWVHEILNDQTGSELVSEMKRKYRLAI